MPTLTHLSFDNLPGGSVQVNYRYDDDSLTSFDPAQLPEHFREVWGDAGTSLTETLANQQTTLAAQTAEIQAKDANSAVLMDQLHETTTQLTAAQARIAELEPPAPEAPTP